MKKTLAVLVLLCIASLSIAQSKADFVGIWKIIVAASGPKAGHTIPTYLELKKDGYYIWGIDSSASDNAHSIPRRNVPHLNCESMKTQSPSKVKDGDNCSVVAGTHAGKSGTVRDVHTSKAGHITITVEQANGARFKTLAKNVVVQTRNNA
jgi:hypothetical protein